MSQPRQPSTSHAVRRDPCPPATALPPPARFLGHFHSNTPYPARQAGVSSLASFAFTFSSVAASDGADGTCPGTRRGPRARRARARSPPVDHEGVAPRRGRSDGAAAVVSSRRLRSGEVPQKTDRSGGFGLARPVDATRPVETVARGGGCQQGACLGQSYPSPMECIPDTPCMLYMPTLGWFGGSMSAYIAVPWTVWVWVRFRASEEP